MVINNHSSVFIWTFTNFPITYGQYFCTNLPLVLTPCKCARRVCALSTQTQCNSRTKAEITNFCLKAQAIFFFTLWKVFRTFSKSKCTPYPKWKLQIIADFHHFQYLTSQVTTLRSHKAVWLPTFHDFRIWGQTTYYVQPRTCRSR